MENQELAVRAFQKLIQLISLDDRYNSEEEATESDISIEESLRRFSEEESTDEEHNDNFHILTANWTERADKLIEALDSNHKEDFRIVEDAYYSMTQLYEEVKAHQAEFAQEINRRKLVGEFNELTKIIRKGAITKIKHRSSSAHMVCPDKDCKNRVMTQKNEIEYACTNCGRVKKVIINDSSSSNFTPDEFESKNSSAYKIDQHFYSWMNAIQGGKPPNKDVPKVLINYVRNCVWKSDITRVGITHIRQFMGEFKQTQEKRYKIQSNQYYQYAVYVLNVVTNSPTTKFTPDEASRIKSVFSTVYSHYSQIFEFKKNMTFLPFYIGECIKLVLPPGQRLNHFIRSIPRQKATTHNKNLDIWRQIVTRIKNSK